MLIFRLLNDWDSENEGSWDKLIEKQLGSSVHPNRKFGFIRSREALIQCFAQAGQNLKIEQLELESFSQLKDFKNFNFSLSHNQEWGAALLGNSSEYLSVGVDIEDKTRRVKDTILERICHPLDFKIAPIINWAIKEATFKALMNTQKFEKPLEFNSIQILEDQFFHQTSGLKGKWEQVPHESLVIIQAWINAI